LIADQYSLISVNPDEILTQQGIGFICPTLESMSEKLLMLSKNTNKLKQMGKKAYSYVLENHSYEKIIEKIISLMQ